MSRVVVLSGPSAVGKSTVVRCLRDRVPDLHFSRFRHHQGPAAW